MTFRVIRGGREDGTPPGLLVVGASEVVTLAGGLRTGRSGRRRSPAADAGGTDSPAAPVVAVWEGRVVAAGPRSDVERFVEGEASAGALRPPRCPGRRGHAGPHRPAHAPVVRRQPRGRARAAAARRRYRRSSPPAAASSRRSRGRAAATATSGPTAGAGSTRCSPTGRRRSRRSRATASTSRASCASSRSPTSWEPPGRSTWSRPTSGRTRSRPSSATAPTAWTHMSATSSRSSCRAWPPEAGAGSATCSARRACSRPHSRADPSRRLGARSRATPACRRARAVRRRGAGGGDRRGVRGPPAAPSGGHRRPRRGRRRRAAGRGDGAAGNDVVPDEVAPRAGPDVHRSRHPGRDRDRLQPGRRRRRCRSR